MARHPLGIDYASVDDNAPPDLARAKAAGLRYVIVRGSLGSWQDPTAARDRDAIRAAGLVYGAYIGPDISASAPAPDAQVAAFNAAAGLQANSDFAPVIDIEFPKKIAGTGMTPAEIANWIAQLIASVSDTFGCNPIVYSSARVLDGSDADALAGATDDAIGDCPLWLARYPFATDEPARIDGKTLDSLAPPPVPNGLGDADGWWLHQYQGDARSFPGLSKQADCDRFNPASSATQGTRRAWIAARLGLDTPSDGDLDAAIRSFQQDQSLGVDGIIGPLTFAALSWQP